MKQLISLLLLIVISAGCSTQNSNEAEDTLTIYTSIYPIQYFTEKIGGEAVSVETIYPPGADAHTFEPTAKTMTTIAKADAFIYLGAGLEGFAGTAADALGEEDVELVELGKHESLFSESGHDHTHDGHSHENHDPHIWIDPIRAIEMADYITEALINIDPDKKEQFKENHKELTENLTALHQEFENLTNNATRNKILVSHAAYGYWEQRYGIEQLSVNGLSPTSDPSQKDLEGIIQKAKKLDMKYMIYEQNVSSQVSSIIQEELNAKSLTIHNLSVLTEEDIEENEDYMSLMRHNLGVLQKALGAEQEGNE
ncbi:metal ABC transporter solute-binding protein, Zn/Mn family [Pontibacillus yanchengensis]|uniref:Adhesin n=1 Tax=Pontibacillus yanchengensis Y32 TaxID=1385514 RepID=A0A0A2TTF6_9BACI|nr:zinc ABC transporter substrate-binding protein [Pontibacillus yanchengensis]KGP72555.1 adhesin [Pontibacillus yanchengensis Y32]